MNLSFKYFHKHDISSSKFEKKKKKKKILTNPLNQIIV